MNVEVDPTRLNLVNSLIRITPGSEDEETEGIAHGEDEDKDPIGKDGEEVRKFII